jgi:hypothetical protein
MKVVVQYGWDFATFERVEYKVVLLLLCLPFSAVLVCVEEAVSLLVVGFSTSALWLVV